MFCPNCRIEYREGFTICSDCGAKLVKELPPEKTELEEPVTVLETADLAIVALAKSMLEEAGIEYIAKGELPLEQLAVGPVEIQVSRDDEDEARELMESIEEGAEGFVDGDETEDAG